MGRAIRIDSNFDAIVKAAPLPADAIMAPHRYLYSGAIRPDGEPKKLFEMCDNWKERQANFSYLPGEVVYVSGSGKPGTEQRALILHIGLEFNVYGERREWLRVSYETKHGKWSRLWDNCYPGFIQRGYKAAGLAPDVID